jgi:uncharacterized protein YndB with AHSA1/START domain
MRRDLQFETVYPNSPEEVWRALTDSDALAGWLMENDFVPKVGHQFHFIAKMRFGMERKIPCEVLQLEAPSVLSFSWDSKGSVVTFRLQPVAEGTRLRLEHTGFRGPGGLALAWILSHGWVHKIEDRLPAVLARLALSKREGTTGQTATDAENSRLNS